MNQKSVFAFGDEFSCQQFWCTDRNVGGIDIYVGTKHIGEILNLDIPDIDDEEENIEFDKTVEEWISTESDYL